ncbi:hypothetical protein CBL_03747 [Carabus blaptoides fortunei]
MSRYRSVQGMPCAQLFLFLSIIRTNCTPFCEINDVADPTDTLSVRHSTLAPILVNGGSFKLTTAEICSSWKGRGFGRLFCQFGYVVMLLLIFILEGTASDSSVVPQATATIGNPAASSNNGLNDL